MFILDYAMVTCGNIGTEFSELFPTLTSTAMTIVKIAVPLILIVFGMLDMGKAIVQQKEEDIKKAQNMFVKRLIAAVLVFLIVFVVQLVFGLVAQDDSDNITGCINCFLNGPDSCG